MENHIVEWKIWKGSKWHNQKENFSQKKRNVDQKFGGKFLSKIKTSKLKSRRSEKIVHLHIAEGCGKLWSLWQGRCTILKLFSTRTVFAFPYCDCCGIWRWICLPDCSISTQISSAHVEERDQMLWGTLEQDCLWLVSAKNNKSVSDWSIQVCTSVVERAATCLVCARIFP